MYRKQYAMQERFLPSLSERTPAKVPKTIEAPNPPMKSTAMLCLEKPYEEYSAYT